jgi:molybdenum cofactor synthesis domain-containing protein
VIPLHEAQGFVLQHCGALPARLIPLDQLLSCVIASDVIATENVPPFANSAMDGYALRAVDTGKAPVQLEVIGKVTAGHLFDGTVGPGQAVRIMTGAPLPAGADAVCMQERTETVPGVDVVTVLPHLRPGENVRPPGRDVAAGDVVATGGTVVNPAYIGVLASQGLASVKAVPRPRVGVLSTGDELFSGVVPLPSGHIRDSNRPTLLALAEREGWDCIDLGSAPDDEDALVQVLRDAAPRCDAILTTGGVSVGDFDLVRVVLEKLSAGKMRWMQVAIKPAKPFAFGVVAGSQTAVFGLPGNPVSAIVSFELFVRPALRQMSGHRVLDRLVVRATAVDEVRRRADGKIHFQRGRVTLHSDGTWRAAVSGRQESHQLLAVAEANALLRLPDGDGVPAGGQVDVIVLDLDSLA